MRPGGHEGIIPWPNGMEGQSEKEKVEKKEMLVRKPRLISVKAGDVVSRAEAPAAMSEKK